MKRATVLLADDHAIVVEGLRRVLEPEFEVVGVVADGRALVRSAEALRPDIAVVDVSMPLLNGIEAARQIRKTNSQSRIVFLSMHPDVVYVSEGLLAGGSAYVLKSSAGLEILTAIRAVLQGGTYITPSVDTVQLQTQIRRAQSLETLSLPPRQREVLQLVIEGHSTKKIAEILNISSRTVEFHRYRIMQTLDMHSIADLVQFAIKHQIVPPMVKSASSV